LIAPLSEPSCFAVVRFGAGPGIEAINGRSRGGSLVARVEKSEEELAGPSSTLSQGATDQQNRHSPLVSVVIPAYQCAEHITHAIDSVLAQTFLDYEILIVNDGSPDARSLELALKPYEMRIRYIKQENRGPSGARNKGVMQAKGKYIAFLDSDDSWFPDHLSSQVSMLLNNPSLDLVYSDSVLARGGKPMGHAFGLEPQHPPVTFEKLLTEECTVSTSSTVASRQALIEAGLFDERFCRCEDFDLWLRMSFRGAKMDYHSDLQVLHNISPEGLSGNCWAMKRARIEIYEKTASTLPISASRRNLIGTLVAKHEAECQTDLAKQFLHAREYSQALDAARRASATKRGWRMRVTIFGLRTAPGAFRRGHIAYERVLRIVNRVRRARLLPKLKINGFVRPSSGNPPWTPDPMLKGRSS
jgi:glycosyltransferase involved in cell wall biosynthesis